MRVFELRVRTWCWRWGCRNSLNETNHCDYCGAIVCSEHMGFHWEKAHGQAQG